jgi:hypothetical protein
MPVDVASRMQLVIDPDLRERIRNVAKLHRRSVSSEICTAIEAWLVQHEAELQSPADRSQPN